MDKNGETLKTRRPYNELKSLRRKIMKVWDDHRNCRTNTQQSGRLLTNKSRKPKKSPGESQWESGALIDRMVRKEGEKEIRKVEISKRIKKSLNVFNLALRLSFRPLHLLCSLCQCGLNKHILSEHRVSEGLPPHPPPCLHTGDTLLILILASPWLHRTDTSPTVQTSGVVQGWLKYGIDTRLNSPLV